jgi:hypothetical protein
VGASLLAKVECQAMKILKVPTPSRASHAPTVIGVAIRAVNDT